MTKRLNRLVLLLIAVPLFLGCSTGANRVYAADEITIETQFDTANVQEDGFDHFPVTQKKDDITYTLETVDIEILKEVPIPQELIILEGESFTGDPENHRPQETVEKDGKMYRLKDSEYMKVRVDERIQDVSTVIPYVAVEYMDTLPDIGEIDIEDENTHQMMTARLPYKSHTVSEAYWDDNFSVPLTVVSYDAEIYELGDVEIPRNADLTSYSRELLAYLGLPEEYYRIQNINWEGDSYESNGEIRRDATATGQRLVKDIEVTYAGQVIFEGIDAHAFNSVYEAVPEEGAADTIYTMKATATYIQDGLGKETENTKSWWDWIRRFWDFIRNHPILSISIGLAIIVFAIVIILYILTKEKKDKEDEK